MENAIVAGPPGYGPRPTMSGRRLGLSPARAAVLDAVADAFPEARTITALASGLGLHVNTVREHLDSLVKDGLVRRTARLPAGRGRPPQLFEAVPRDAASDNEYGGLAAALAAHLDRTSQRPSADAVEAGRAWGARLATDGGPPATPSATGARRQVVALLDDMGFAPRADPRATTAALTRCPLLDAAVRHPDVVCGVHLGIVRGALEEYGADADGADLLPFAEPGACRLHLAADGRP